MYKLKKFIFIVFNYRFEVGEFVGVLDGVLEACGYVYDGGVTFEFVLAVDETEDDERVDFLLHVDLPEAAGLDQVLLHLGAQLELHLGIVALLE